MAKKYSLISVKILDDSFWSIYEKETQQVINVVKFKKEAVDIVTFLENDGAFSGFTPSFMLKSSKISDIDIDDRFEREVCIS